MNYINTTTFQQFSESEIRAANPNTSYPVPFIEPEGYAFIFPAPQPAHDPITQRVQAFPPELTTLGHWEQRWEVVDLYATQAEKDEALAADLEAKRIAAVPAFVTMQQAELALLEADLLDDIEALIPTLPRANQIAWKRASIVERTHPLVAYVQQTKGLTDLQIDDLFTHAATL